MRVVVVGAGLAGSRACEELRAQGHDGPVTLVGAEPYLPYDRPPLSKGLLLGEVEDTILRPSYDDLGVKLILGCRATGLTPDLLHTDQGPLPWDGLVLATGAAPVRLPGDGEQLVLRSVDDAKAVRGRLRPGAHLVIVGAGWIGAEVATAARALDAEVTVVEAADTPLAHALGTDVGARTTPWYAEAGVRLLLRSAVERVRPGGLDLAGGSRLDADAVLTAVGVRPDAAWLADSGLELDRGVATDERCATSWPGVVAVGDCAARWSPRAGRRLRAEHWDDAVHGPTAAVATLLGGRPDHDPVPYFWSEQFGRFVQYVGEHQPGDVQVGRGDPAGPDWSVAWLRDSRLTALLAVNRPRDLLQARRAIAAGATPDPGRLADLDVAVRAA